MCSHERSVKAKIEIVVVLSVGVGNMLASATYRLGTSWHALHRLVTNFFGSLPNLTVPVSCRLCPGGSGSELAPHNSPPARRRISAHTCLECSSIISSLGPHS